eukprot:c24689_g1_i1 orf=263-2077(-)
MAKKARRSMEICPQSSNGSSGREVGEENADSGRLMHDTLMEFGEGNAITGYLTDDTLIHVLQYLSTRFLLSCGALVCRRWRRLCCSHLFLELIPSSFSSYDKPWGSLMEQDIMCLAKCHASTLEKLHLNCLKHLKSGDLASLIRNLTRLKELVIVSCPLLISDLEAVTNCLPSNLKRLDVHVDHLHRSYCHDSLQPTLTSVHDSFLASLQKQCPNLEVLDLDACSGITTQGLDSLLRAIPTLCSLDLHSHAIGWLDVKKIFMSCVSLCHLSLVSSCFVDDSSSSDDEGGGRMLGGRGKFNRRGWGQNSFPPISENHNFSTVVPSSLCSLRLYSDPHHSVPLDCSPVSILLKERGHQLRHFHAQSLFNTSWHTISVWCVNLQTLDLSHAWDKQLDITGIEEVVLCGLPRLLKSLLRIGLPSVNDRILVELGRFCPKLKEVRIEGYKSASPSVRSQGSVTDRGVRALSEGCFDLQVLSLVRCHKVTAGSLRALAFHCQDLKELHLTGCRGLKDDAVSIILPMLSNSLLLLDVVGCPKITSASIVCCLQHMKIHRIKLRVLAISREIWRSCKSEISELKCHAPSLSIRSGSSGIHWDGFYHSRALEF